MKPIPKCLKAQSATWLPACPPPCANREREERPVGGWRGWGRVWGGCLTAVLTQWSDRVRFVFGGFGKSGTVSSSFRQKGKTRRSRTTEHDNQLYFMSLYSNLLHPPCNTYHPPSTPRHHPPSSAHTGPLWRQITVEKDHILLLLPQTQIGTNWSRGTFFYYYYFCVSVRTPSCGRDGCRGLTSVTHPCTTKLQLRQLKWR